MSPHPSWSSFEVGSVVRQKTKLTCAASTWPMGKPQLCPCKPWRCRLPPGQPSLLALPSCAALSFSAVSDSLQLHRLEPARFLCPWGFSRQESWSGLPCLSPGDLPDPGIEPRSPTLWADSLLSELPGKPSSLLGNAKYHFTVKVFKARVG